MLNHDFLDNTTCSCTTKRLKYSLSCLDSEHTLHNIAYILHCLMFLVRNHAYDGMSITWLAQILFPFQRILMVLPLSQFLFCYIVVRIAPPLWKAFIMLSTFCTGQNWGVNCMPKTWPINEVKSWWNNIHLIWRLKTQLCWQRSLWAYRQGY